MPYIPAIIMAGFCLVLIQFPLFDYLGYEFSAACALVLPFLVGPVVISSLKPVVRDHSDGDLFRFSIAWEKAFRSIKFLLLIPFLVATLNIFFVKNCSYGEGVLFYVLIPVITALWSMTLAQLCVVITRHALLLYYFTILLVLLHPLYLGYFTPAIYSYNFIYGYFPGFSYDEVLTVTPTLWLFRGVTLLCSMFIVFGSMMVLSASHRSEASITSRKVRFFSTHPTLLQLLTVLCLIGLVILWIFRCQLGFETSQYSIEESLSGVYRTDHFIIRYAPGMFTRKELEFAGQEHEFRLFQDEKALHITRTTPITSFIYPDEETKRRYIGTGTTNIAKPWRSEMHLNFNSWQEVLKHELVHVLAGEFGMPVIHAHYNIGLTEGLATAIDDDWGNRTLHQYAASMKKFGIVQNPEQLISAEGFMTHSSSLSYVAMGSFCKFIIDRYGIDKFKQLYGGKDFQSVYGVTTTQLIEQWQAMIDTIEIPDSWRKHVEYYFKRPSIFAKECARTTARLNQEGNTALADRDLTKAREYYGKSLSASWNTGAFTGFIRTQYMAGFHNSVINMMKKQLRDSTHRASLSGVFMIYGTSLWAKEDTASARFVYNEILDLNLSQPYNAEATIRLHFLSDTTVSQAMAVYYTSTQPGIQPLSEVDSLLHRTPPPSPPSLELLAYLHSQQSYRLKRYDSAITGLTPLTFSELPILEFSKNELLGKSWFGKGDYSRAEDYFSEMLRTTTNESARKGVEDWIKRCEWFKNHRKEQLE